MPWWSTLYAGGNLNTRRYAWVILSDTHPTLNIIRRKIGGLKRQDERLEIGWLCVICAQPGTGEENISLVLESEHEV